MTTKITLPITITLKDPRHCTGCPMQDGSYCDAFRTKDGFGRFLRFDHEASRYRRLPQCIAAATEVV